MDKPWRAKITFLSVKRYSWASHSVLKIEILMVLGCQIPQSIIKKGQNGTKDQKVRNFDRSVSHAHCSHYTKYKIISDIYIFEFY